MNTSCKIERRLCWQGAAILCVALALILTGLVLFGVRVGAALAHPLQPAQAAATPWVVFTPVTNTLPMAANVVTNAGFEAVPLVENGWSSYLSGYEVDDAGGHSGRALKLVNSAAAESHGASQSVVLNQAKAAPLYFSAWSKAENVSGEANADYSVYIDLQYTDGTPLYGQVLTFDTGTHGWQFREGYIVPDKPVESFRLYCLLRRTHSGTAWFDEIAVRQVQAGLTTFDSVPVATGGGAAPGGTTLALATGDGLALALDADSGMVSDVRLGGEAVTDLEHRYASGFLVRDVAAQGDYFNVGGSLTQNAAGVEHASTLAALDLAFSAHYTATADRISVHATLTDTRGADRALTLYFALPVDAEGWAWGDDIRSSRPIDGNTELANLGGFVWTRTIGATGQISRYPWAAISGPSDGLALGVPLDQPRILRLIHNPFTHQFYAAFDLGLSPHTTKFPGQAEVEFVIYRFDGPDGFRAATQGYYDRFPGFFTRRIAPEQEGLWVAFSDLSPIEKLEDFGIAIHELGGLNQVAFDDTADVISFRYVSEPWSHWLPITTTAVDVNDYDQVLAYLQERYANGPDAARAEATLSSGIFDDQGRYVYKADLQPWCVGVGGCAAFQLNADPDIADAAYPLDKGQLDWNDTKRQAYTTTPGLDGEYIDSFTGKGSTMDFRTAHWAAADTPLTYRFGDWRVGMPLLFATTEFARAVAQDVHGMGKLMMANGIATDTPWGTDLFDMLGQETDWINDGSFVPISDGSLSYRRTFAYQRPYGFLMNTNFDTFGYPLVERYFQTCLFYGIYPSMFSHNAAEDRYWDDPALYNRDRPLFQRYIPIIKQLNGAGWRPVTHAQTSDPGVYIERFGDWPQLHFTLRNTTELTVTVAITVEADALNLPGGGWAAISLVRPATAPFTGTGARRWFTVTLPPLASEAVAVSRSSRLYLPVVIR